MKITARFMVRIVLLVLLTIFSDTVLAENMGFLPGDAFFHGRLSSSLIEEAGSAGHVSLEYSATTGGSFSGYAGFFRLNLQLDDPAFLSNLSQAYEWLRYSSPRTNWVRHEYRDEGERLVKSLKAEEVEELNPFGMFVYNKGLDLNSIRLSVKYNENWESEVALFNKRTSRRPLLDEFVKSYECVSESWGNAERVPAFKVKLPEVAEYKRGQGIDEPMVCPASECTVVVTSSKNYKEVFSCSRDAQIVVVTAADVQYFQGKGRKWERQEMTKIVNEDAK